MERVRGSLHLHEITPHGAGIASFAGSSSGMAPERSRSERWRRSSALRNSAPVSATRIVDTAATWDPEDEQVYRALRRDLAPEIQARVIEQNSWRELIQVAFDLAAEHFPLVYREDAFDYFRPTKAILAELVYDLSTKSFSGLTNRHVGDIYQGLLSARRKQQAQVFLGIRFRHDAFRRRQEFRQLDERRDALDAFFAQEWPALAFPRPEILQTGSCCDDRAAAAPNGAGRVRLSPCHSPK